MQPLHTPTANPFAHTLRTPFRFVRQCGEKPQHGLLSFLARIFNVRARAEDDIVTRFAGYGWNDSRERQMIDDIAAMRCERF